MIRPEQSKQCTREPNWHRYSIFSSKKKKKKKLHISDKYVHNQNLRLESLHSGRDPIPTRLALLFTAYIRHYTFVTLRDEDRRAAASREGGVLTTWMTLEYRSNSDGGQRAALAHLISDRFMCWMKRVGKLTATSKGAINYGICQPRPQRWLKTNCCQYRRLNFHWYLINKQPQHPHTPLKATQGCLLSSGKTVRNVGKSMRFPTLSNLFRLIMFGYQICR